MVLKLDFHSKCSLYLIMYLLKMVWPGKLPENREGAISSDPLCELPRTQRAELRAEYEEFQKTGDKREVRLLQRTRGGHLSGNGEKFH